MSLSVEWTGKLNFCIHFIQRHYFFHVFVVSFILVRFLFTSRAITMTYGCAIRKYFSIEREKCNEQIRRRAKKRIEFAVVPFAAEHRFSFHRNLVKTIEFYISFSSAFGRYHNRCCYRIFFWHVFFYIFVSCFLSHFHFCFDDIWRSFNGTFSFKFFYSMLLFFLPPSVCPTMVSFSKQNVITDILITLTQFAGKRLKKKPAKWKRERKN